MADGDGQQLSTLNDFVCKIKYRNTLPELPFDPKLVQYPFDPNRFVKYKPTSLERTYKYPLLTEPDLGVPLDLIDPDTYKIPSGSWTVPPADAALLNKDAFAKAKKKEDLRPQVPWLRKMEYMTDFSTKKDERPRLEDTVRARAQALRSQQDGPEERELIEKSFLDAKKTPVHPTNPNLVPEMILPVLPDLTLVKNNYFHVVFESAPHPYLPHPADPDYKEKSAHQEYLVKHSVLKAVTQDSAKYLIMLVPRKSARDVAASQAQSLKPPGSTQDDAASQEQEEEYDWSRKFRYSLTGKEYGRDFLLVWDKHQIRYVPLEQKAKITKAPQGPMEERPVKATLRKRPLKAEEITARKEKLARFETEAMQHRAADEQA
jgi:RNA polymerase II-associated factor 1